MRNASLQAISAKIDPEIVKLLKEEANRQFSSVNAVIRQIFAKHFNLTIEDRPVHKEKRPYKRSSRDSDPSSKQDAGSQ